MSEEERYIEELIQDIVDHGGIGDMTMEQALREAHDRRQAFAREMADGISDRSKLARFAMAASMWADIRNRHNNRMAVNQFANRCFEIAG